MNKHLTSLPTIYPSEIAQKGMEVYQRISKRIEKKHTGNFIAIEIESGRYFLGQTQVEAIEKAKRHFPTKIFYLMKVGFPAVVTFSGYQRPLSYGNRVPTTLTAGAEALAGTSLLTDYELRLNFPEQKINLEKV